MANAIKFTTNVTKNVARNVTSVVNRNPLAELLNNRTIKVKLNIIVLPLVLLALYGVGMLLRDAYSDYKRSTELQKANAVSDQMLKAVGEQAKERGFTATVLANPNDKATLGKIAGIRANGDSHVDSALRIARELLDGNALAAKRLQAVETLRNERDEFRKRNDAVLGASAADAASMKAWIALQSKMIMAENALCRALFVTDNAMETILEFNSQIKESVFYASEFAGRERANLGTAIGTGKPIDAERLNSLMQFRGVVQENLNIIIDFEDNPEITPPIRQAIEAMKTTFLGEFEQTRKAVYAASAAGEPYPMTTSEWIQRSTNAINSILKVSDVVSVEVERLSGTSRRTSFRAVVIAALLVVVLTLLIVLSRSIGTLVVERIIHLRNAAKKVQEGDLTQHIGDNLHDELGELTKSFNGMVGNIRQGIEDLQTEKASIERKVEEAVRESEQQRTYLASSVELMLRHVEMFSQGDLTQRLPVSSQDDIGRLFQGYNQALESVAAILEKIIEASEITAAASTEITVSIEHMSASITEQAVQATEIATATEEMSKTIEENTQQTALSADKAAEASKKATASGASIQSMINAMNTIAETVGKSATNVEELGKSSEQIGEIVKTIEEIADQTNLLALNAAIEAARAGEQGRGFAVVADEVRKLAERTQQATKEIALTIRRIDTDTRSVVQTMNIGRTEVEEGTSLVLGASDSLRFIIERIGEISALMAQLAATSEEQAATSNQIAANMDSMSMVVAESAAVTEEIVRTSENLSKMTHTVQDLILKFKVREDNTRSNKILETSAQYLIDNE
jgi:methyl-accepting chemotaxis protein